MPLNTDPNFPPFGNPPYAIDREWCLGDSLFYLNRNFDFFDTKILTLSSAFPVQANNIASNAVTTPKLAAGAVTNEKLANAAVAANNMSGNQTGPAPAFAIRAWAQWAGTAVNGSVPFTGGNVLDVNRTASGTYRVTFNTPMPDTNYAISVASSNNLDRMDTNTARTNSFFSVDFFSGGGTAVYTAVNPAYCSVIVIR
jgi:hypothetical protein